MEKNSVINHDRAIYILYIFHVSGVYPMIGIKAPVASLLTTKRGKKGAPLLKSMR